MSSLTVRFFLLTEEVQISPIVISMDSPDRAPGSRVTPRVPPKRLVRCWRMGLQLKSLPLQTRL